MKSFSFEHISIFFSRYLKDLVLAHFGSVDLAHKSFGRFSRATFFRALSGEDNLSKSALSAQFDIFFFAGGKVILLDFKNSERLISTTSELASVLSNDIALYRDKMNLTYKEFGEELNYSYSAIQQVLNPKYRVPKIDRVISLYLLVFPSKKIKFLMRGDYESKYS